MKENKLKVLGCFEYLMGHVTHQMTLERAFKESAGQIDFIPLKIGKGNLYDLLDRCFFFVLGRHIPGFKAGGWVFVRRLRIGLYSSFSAGRLIKRYLKHHGVDVLFFHTQAAALFAKRDFADIPFVVSLDSTGALQLAGSSGMGSPPLKVLIKLENTCFHAASHIIAWSDWARDSVIHDYGVPPDKVTTIHPGIPLERFAGIQRAPSYNNRLPRLLFIGNNWIRKGGEDLAFVFQNNFKGNCQLDIVTNDKIFLPDLPGLRVYSDIAPLSDKIIERFREADIFVLPTHEDCHPMVLVEAMAAGLACISTRVMAVPELVIDGVTGLIVEKGSRTQLVDAIRQLLLNPARAYEMGLAGRRHVRALCDPQANCLAMADIFIRAAKRSGKNKN